MGHRNRPAIGGALSRCCRARLSFRLEGAGWLIQPSTYRCGSHRAISSNGLVVEACCRIYGLSNGALDEPWPKTMRLKARLLEWIVKEENDPALLLDDLREESSPEVGIPSAMPSDVPQEPPLSSIFVRNPIYGTRCSTIVAVDDRGQGIF